MFDKYGHCRKCRQSVHRMKKTKIWHHIDYSDYVNCGAVELEDDVRAETPPKKQ